ncbi:sulfurtransferase complex subunit TusB [Microbulbifer sp. YPW1]|uniref:sulfurtransferase complex subunit TusB n=1 Tax=Microbulbifer sp. YPW1 TaxID=2745199 RepID=UPI0015986B6C|nr:sulfurtransferase complex subunit TusB [Microbulbifer sp. YPW1]QKX18378.1 sulfurtransferase complex subunit TusB [Microbulbifer sp. YPW1]
MTLHIVSQSPFSGSALNDCLAAFTDGDALLLIEDAVYAANGPTLTQLKGKSVYCLQPDAVARGIPVDPAIEAIDETRWVSLCTEHNPIVSWFR